MIFLARLAARLPLPLLHFLGALTGWLVYGLSPRTRRQLRENLRQAGYTDAATRRRSIAEAGKAIWELPAVWLRSHDEIAGMVAEVRGLERLEQVLAAKKGLILLTPHLGCWEIAGQYFSHRRPLTVLYSPPKVRWLEPLMRAGRNRDTLKSVPTDLSGVRALYRALKRGGMIGVLPDQVPGVGDGEWAEFFARPAYTMTLAMRIAAATGAPVLVTFAERLAGGRGFRIHIDPMEPPLPGESPVRCMNRALESLIRRCPSQYLWAYNRYKVPSGAPSPERPAEARREIVEQGGDAPL